MVAAGLSHPLLKGNMVRRAGRGGGQIRWPQGGRGGGWLSLRCQRRQQPYSVSLSPLLGKQLIRSNFGVTAGAHALTITKTSYRDTLL
jgi:hypothetical protein